MAHITRRLAVASCLLIALALTGCSNNPAGPLGTNVGTVHVSLTDAPAAYDAVNVTITSFMAHHAGGSEAPSAWENLRTTPMTVNLLTLAGQLAELANASVPTGSYDALKLTIGPGATIVVDGVSHPLTVPSNTVRIMAPFTISSGGVINMLMDFDVSASVHQTGSGTWMLQPVIHTSRSEEVGTINGTVTNVTGTATVMLVSSTGDTLRTMRISTDGRFAFYGVRPGTYTLIVRESGTTDLVRTNVVVVAGRVTTISDLTFPPTTGGTTGGGGPTPPPDTPPNQYGG